MTDVLKFSEDIQAAFSCKGPYILLGAGMYEGAAAAETHVRIPIKMLNRHGLIAGATGTGKTKTLQLLAEGLSREGVPVLMMDLKGDLSGILKPGADSQKIQERHAQIGEPFTPSGFPVEFLTLSDEPGIRLRATVTEFGPVLFSKILSLNDTQSGIVAVLFQYCDENKLPLLDLKDFKKTLQFITHEGKAAVEKDFGRISSSSTGAIMRRIVELEQQGGDQFFGERSFEVYDLVRRDAEGRGMISMLRLTDIQDKPKLFSTFMLALLAEIYSTFPEQGDQDKPKLVLFIDEAHLIFEDASKELLNQLEAIIRLIRSKGIGIFFCTQTPRDVPKDILGQLGLKVQHALRAFTAADRKTIKLTAENFPPSSYYKIDQLLTQMGIGEALVTALNDKGIPTPAVATLLCAPASRMGTLSHEEIQAVVNQSLLVEKYNQEIDSKSAYEILNEKIAIAKKRSRSSRKEKSAVDDIIDSTLTRQIGRTVVREIIRGILGVLGVKRR